jgi:hypothetical protein
MTESIALKVGVGAESWREDLRRLQEAGDTAGLRDRKLLHIRAQ